MSHNKDKIKRALVTGATGFVGGHLVKRLLADGWVVCVVVRPDSDLSLFGEYLDRGSIFVHDGTTEGMLNVVTEAKPDLVFHLASFFLAQHESKDIEELIRSNLLFGTQLVEAMVKCGVFNLVNTGTSWQHFNNEDYNPVCLYAATKQAFETILKFYTEKTSLKVVTLKLFDTYGPNDKRGKLFSLLHEVAFGNKALTMSPGEQLINLVYIGDVIDAFVVAAERLQKGLVKENESYSVSSKSPMRLKDLAGVYSSVTGKDLQIEWGGRPYRVREVMVPWNRGKCLPGWKPKMGLKDGVRLTEGLSHSVTDEQ